mmetsp:Transcript_27494/g.88781  ORF Transcript_27494/g.88781 Transcript_27494/m.88781 type:complete len:288 (+) Transcript_27494:1394-2257(+)
MRWPLASMATTAVDPAVCGVALRKASSVATNASCITALRSPRPKGKASSPPSYEGVMMLPPARPPAAASLAPLPSCPAAAAIDAMSPTKSLRCSVMPTSITIVPSRRPFAVESPVSSAASLAAMHACNLCLQNSDASPPPWPSYTAKTEMAGHCGGGGAGCGGSNRWQMTCASSIVGRRPLRAEHTQMQRARSISGERGPLPMASACPAVILNAREATRSDERRMLVPLDEPRSEATHPELLPKSAWSLELPTHRTSAWLAEIFWSASETSLLRARPMVARPRRESG